MYARDQISHSDFDPDFERPVSLVVTSEVTCLAYYLSFRVCFFIYLLLFAVCRTLYFFKYFLPFFGIKLTHYFFNSFRYDNIYKYIYTQTGEGSWMTAT